MGKIKADEIEKSKEILRNEEMSKYEELIDSIIERCKESKIEFYRKNVETFFFDDDDDDIEMDSVKALIIKIKSGREEREVGIEDLGDAEIFRSIMFEDLNFLNGYDAICSYERGFIEARLEQLNRKSSNRILYKRIFNIEGKLSSQELKKLSLNIVKTEGNQNIKIKIGYPSKEGRGLLEILRLIPNPTIRVEGINISNNDQAINLLNKISEALFFQIDIKYNLPLSIAKDKKRGKENESLLRKENLELKFPEITCDEEPLSLYWYARSAEQMPLLVYLAYYQTIEYYYPRYSEINAKKMVLNMLKNPIFDYYNDSDISRLINTIKKNTEKGNNDEKTQLFNTLKECINIIELKEFVKDSKEFYQKKEATRLSKYKIQNTSEDTQFLHDIVNRVYDIRCKIVHTKADNNLENLERILPFSKNESLLNNDINLVRFLSEKVLIASASEFSL